MLFGKSEIDFSSANIEKIFAQSVGTGIWRKKIFIKEKSEWEVPIIRYAKTGQFPGWIKLLGRWDMGFR